MGGGERRDKKRSFVFVIKFLLVALITKLDQIHDHSVLTVKLKIIHSILLIKKNYFLFRDSNTEYCENVFSRSHLINSS